MQRISLSPFKMLNFATSIASVNLFIIWNITTANLLQRRPTAGGSFRCNAWIIVDSITTGSNRIYRHYHNERHMNRLKNLNIRSNSYLGWSLPVNLNCRHHMNLPISTTATTSEINNNPLEPLKNEINQRIYNVANTTCRLSPNQVRITWKPKRIVVTVHTENAFLDTSTSDGDDDDDITDDEIDFDFIDEEDVLYDDDDVESIAVDNVDNDSVQDDGNPLADTILNESTNILTTITSELDAPKDDATASVTAESVDLALLARSINAALDDGEDGVGTRIAHLYEIEVSTPGISSDDITTPRMFAAYRGFDVIVHYYDPKKKNMKQHEGRLVEKNEEHVIINQKGRMKHFKNIHVQAVKLPKFKKEKGSQ